MASLHKIRPVITDPELLPPAEVKVMDTEEDAPAKTASRFGRTTLIVLVVIVIILILIVAALYYFKTDDPKEKIVATPTKPAATGGRQLRPNVYPSGRWNIPPAAYTQPMECMISGGRCGAAAPTSTVTEVAKPPVDDHQPMSGSLHENVIGTMTDENIESMLSQMEKDNDDAAPPPSVDDDDDNVPELTSSGSLTPSPPQQPTSASLPTSDVSVESKCRFRLKTGKTCANKRAKNSEYCGMHNK